jgi:uncharacterized protein
MSIITIELLAEIKRHYRMRWMGVHGVIHWSRVYDNGIKLSTQPGVNSNVLQLFSIFHDSQRKNEHWDRNHGKRGAELAVKLRGMIDLNDSDFDLLTTACQYHTSAKTNDDITIATCFDSDRLDLGRVGNYPDPKLLCTPLAKQKKTIEEAYHRSRHQKELPDQPFGLDGL